MTDETKHGNGNPGSSGPFGHGNYERQDMGSKGILYFLVALLVLTAISMVGLRGLYSVLDSQVRSQQPMSPLTTIVPEDTLHIPAGYPQTAFPSPRLEEDERGQLDDIRLRWDNTLYTYAWVDQSAGTVRIPIDRAMDLVAQRGLPVRPQQASASALPENKAMNKTSAAGRPGEMK